MSRTVDYDPQGLTGVDLREVCHPEKFHFAFPEKSNDPFEHNMELQHQTRARLSDGKEVLEVLHTHYVDLTSFYKFLEPRLWRFDAWRL